MTARRNTRLPGRGPDIPLITLTSPAPGPAIILTANLHGDEYTGTAALLNVPDSLLRLLVALRDAGYPLPGADVVVRGGVPFGGGLSSSAALEVALVALVDRLQAGGFTLLDTQWTTPHLEQFGAIEIPRDEYLERLSVALARRCAFSWRSAG